ncbi:group II intron reverse transcriptase/maturase [Paenibacillus sp. Y412MC10]|uniref:group II intron reverse transcriptase/maturase n=1 Tax=Geobacillus sp. (strain Y412MC10) TaxID=481743 RepID=UPI0011AB561A|nr:group II intron reverse transcriptase/maturase [Paenibacillus sp. Y412MC10]
MTTNIKKQTLRNNEYYDVQEVFDGLYAKSKENKHFSNLLPIICSKQNVLLAYRNIKKNKGSQTHGTNRTTIMDVGNSDPDKLVAYVERRLRNYTPHSVRRVFIPKSDGRQRPLGIPSIEDRLIQQCIRQVLEPICEAKFYQHSYGFRPNRSTHHAIARSVQLMFSGFHHVVDIDIKGFFDNVSHGKLIKQLWSLGIRDKNFVCILSKMLKAEIEGEGVPTKGTPQGGILSPLLSNVVLNELDWWISSQWENAKTTNPNHETKGNLSNKYRELRKTNLKQIFMVRYADDFKIFCKDAKTAQKAFVATKKWLHERLGLEISPEKSRVVNLRRNHSDFLGFKLKMRKKRTKRSEYSVESHMSDKAKRNVKEILKQRICEMQTKTSGDTVMRYNSAVLGVHNYYKIATDITADLGRIGYDMSRFLWNRTKQIRSDKGQHSALFNKYYGQYKSKIVYIMGTPLFPIHGTRTQPPMNFTQEISMYTPEGRLRIHDKLRSIDPRTLGYLMDNPVRGESTEFNDNRISLYVGQNGLCAVTKRPLVIGDMEVHHKKPRKDGGTDAYDNLLFVQGDIHRLIHATQPETISRLLSALELNEKEQDKVNKLRMLVGKL